MASRSCAFNVASNFRTRTPEGEWQDKTDGSALRWSVAGRMALQYLKKGAASTLMAAWKRVPGPISTARCVRA